MPRPFYARGPFTILDGTSANSSTYTSSPFLVVDWDKIAISVVTAAASASTVTVQGSLGEGFAAAIAAGTWSALTAFSTANAVDAYNIDPGIRWIRCIRDSADSQLSISLQGHT